MTETHPALQLFEELLVPSPSGREGGVAAIVRAKLEQLGYPHETDPSGNILVRIPGKETGAPLVCFGAHMDEIGMMVTQIEPGGRLRVTNSGGLQPWKLGEGPVDIIGQHKTLTGVLSMGSTHTSGNQPQPITWETCWVLTGLSDEQIHAAGVRPGTFVLPARSRRGPVIFGDAADPLVGAWTFDDRIGVVTLLHLLERIKNEVIEPHHPAIIAFTVREETGGHGAKVIANREQPDIFIAVDGAPIPPETNLALDGRPGIWAKDRVSVYDPILIEAFINAAESAGTGLQTAVFKSAASDASLAAYGAGVPRIACIGQVRENSHGYEVLRLSVLDNLLNTLTAFIRDWKDPGITPPL